MWSRLLVAGFVAAGVREVVVSPGSRSTPLILALLDEPRLRRHVLVDERSAAFFALGQARVTGRPTVLVRTSGSAGANDFPAVVEAAASGVPLIVVTADRPPELQHVQANQTIDQLGLFGGHVRAFFELGSAETTRLGLRAVRRTAVQAVHRALYPEPGPVHLNLRFRKPLEPPAALGEALDEEPDGDHGASSGRVSALRRAVDTVLAHPATTVHRPVRWWSGELLAIAASALRRHARGLLVVGPAPGPSQLAQREIFDLARRISRRTGYPIYAEAASQLRFRAHRLHPVGATGGTDGNEGADELLGALGLVDPFGDDELDLVPDDLVPDDREHYDPEHPAPDEAVFVDGLDALLRAAVALGGGTLPPALRPTLILQIGRPPVSAAWGRLLDELDTFDDLEHWALAPSGWPDAASTLTRLVACDAREGLEMLAEALLDEPSVERGRGAWAERWRRLAAAAGAAADAALDEAASNEAVSDEAVSDEAVSDEAVSNEAVSDEAVSDEAVSDEVEDEAERGRAEGLAEGAIARQVVESLPAGALLMLGNSLPIRTVDLFVDGARVPGDIGVLAQRGASGIDGLVSGAAGAASVSGRPTVLLLGDVSLLHDAGGLAALATVRTPCAVVVVHNGGGRIFEQLPIASRGADMTPWTTPHDHRFEHLARFYGLGFRRAANLGALRDALAEGLADGARPLVVEVRAPEHGAAAVSRRVVELLTPVVRAELEGDSESAGSEPSSDRGDAS